MKGSMKIYDLLKQYNGVVTPEMKRVNYHINLFWRDINFLMSYIPELRTKKTEEEVFAYVFNLLDVCNSLSPNYDSEKDAEITRICLGTDRFKCEDYSPYPDNRGEVLFEDDNLFDGVIDYPLNSKGHGTGEKNKCFKGDKRRYKKRQKIR